MNNFITLLLLLPLFLCAAPPAVPAQPVIGPATVTGTLFPAETDSLGNPVSLYLEIFNRDNPEKSIDYSVTMDAKGKELLNLLYHTITASGTVQMTPDNKPWLTIMKYQVEKSKPEDLEDEY